MRPVGFSQRAPAEFFRNGIHCICPSCMPPPPAHRKLLEWLRNEVGWIWVLFFPETLWRKLTSLGSHSPSPRPWCIFPMLRVSGLVPTWWLMNRWLLKMFCCKYCAHIYNLILKVNLGWEIVWWSVRENIWWLRKWHFASESPCDTADTLHFIRHSSILVYSHISDRSKYVPRHVDSVRALQNAMPLDKGLMYVQQGGEWLLSKTFPTGQLRGGWCANSYQTWDIKGEETHSGIPI